MKVTVDGTDFRVPLYSGNKNFRKYKSHKFKVPGLQYEVGIAIQLDNIMHICYPQKRHGFIFKAIAALEQIDICTGMGLYDAEYRMMMNPERRENFKKV